MRWLSLCLIVTTAHGQFLPGVDPRLPAPEPVESLPSVEAGPAVAVDQDEILIENFLGFQLDSWEGEGGFAALAPGLEARDGLLVPSPTTLAAKLSRYLGGQLKLSDLSAIGDLILIHYDLEGFPVVGVEAPEQLFSEGKLVLVVEVGRTGRVGVTRPKYGKASALQDGLLLEEGELLRRADLDEQMGWYGRSVFRRPRLFVSPGAEPSTADILIGLEEARPWRATVGYENSGTDLLGRDRFLVGVAGMTPGEHIIAWQSVVGMPLSSLNAHAISWEIPLHHLHQTIQLDAAYARVADRSISNGVPIDNKGTSWSTAALHRMSLPGWSGWQHSLSSGVEVKGTDQFLLFGAGSFSPGEVRLVHAKLGYDVRKKWERGGLGVQASVIASPGGLISGNDDADFKAYDPAADSSYVLARASAQGWWSPWGDWRVGVRGSVQVADSRLLPAEQFSAGGYQTVRGFSEREYFADQGWQSTLELVSPAWTPLDDWRIRFVGFLDHAQLRNRGGGNSDTITGSGLGVRMKVSRWVDLRADHGWRLDEGGGHTHVGLRFTY